MINQKIKDLKFISKGKILLINDKQKIKNISNEPLIIIFVFLLNNIKIRNEISKTIICNQCNNLALFTFNEEKKISLENCKNKHKTNDMKIKDFIENQKKESNIKCDLCGNYRNYYNEEFYFSLDEKIFVQYVQKVIKPIKI